MNSTSQSATDRLKTRKMLRSMAAGAVAGGLGAVGILALADSDIVGGLGTSREIAALVALVYLVTALAVGIGASRPSFGALYLNAEDPDELREQKSALILSSLAMAAIGAALFILAFAAPVGPIDAGAALGLAFVLLASCIWLSRRMTALVDELVLEVSRNAAALTFYLLALFGGSWSIIAHLGFAPAPAPLDWLSMFAALLLIASFAACATKGLLTPR
jgi:hypothetical protein